MRKESFMQQHIMLATAGADVGPESMQWLVERLHGDSPVLRLGAIYLLESVARDTEVSHWSIMEMLCDFVRERAPWGGERAAEGLDMEIQAALSVIARRQHKRERREAHHLHLQGTDLRGAFLVGATLNDAFLTGVHLEGAAMGSAHLQRAVCDSAHFEGAWMARVNFRRAQLRGACLQNAWLGRADFTDADLEGANLEGTDLREVRGMTREQFAAAITDEKTIPPMKFAGSRKKSSGAA